MQLYVGLATPFSLYFILDETHPKSRYILILRFMGAKIASPPESPNSNPMEGRALSLLRRTPTKVDQGIMMKLLQLAQKNLWATFPPGRESLA